MSVMKTQKEYLCLEIKNIFSLTLSLISHIGNVISTPKNKKNVLMYQNIWINNKWLIVSQSTPIT